MASGSHGRRGAARVHPAASDHLPPLADLFRNQHALVTGATGFLGKVFLFLLLRDHPEFGRISLLIRGADQADAEERFRKEILHSPVFAALHERDLLRDHQQRIAVVCGDITEPNFGLTPAGGARLRRGVDAIVHIAGLVDFAVSLDRAYRINVLGTKHALEFAASQKTSSHRLAFVHVSTCYVAGRRDGSIDENDLWVDRAPYSEERHGRGRFSVVQEMTDCAAAIARCSEAADEQVQRALFEQQADERLARDGAEVDDPNARAERIRELRRRWVDAELRREGLRRAEHWGWPNTYTYTKSMAEQLVLHTAHDARKYLNVAVVRPAVIESALVDPFPGWNQGVNTSAPLVYISSQGQRFFPVRADLVLDLIPVDLVAHAMVTILGAALAGRQRPVYQLGTSAVNPLPMRRLVELTGLSNRREHVRRGGLRGRLAAELEPVITSETLYNLIGAPGLRRAGEAVTKLSGLLPRSGSWRAITDSVASGGQSLRDAGDLMGRLVDLYRPYSSELRYRFAIRNIRELSATLQPADRARHPFQPEAMDWRHYWMEVHLPGLRRWSFPELDARLQRRGSEPAAALPYDCGDLRGLLEGATVRHAADTTLAAMRATSIERLSYAEVHRRAECVARSLSKRGVRPRDRVVLLSENSPEWGICYFGIIIAGATAVPLDAELPAADLQALVRRSRARVLLVSDRVRARLKAAWREVAADVTCLPCAEAIDRAPAIRVPRALIRPGDVASLVFTSGTTGVPKGVMLTHANLVAQVKMLAQVFRLDHGDVILSVLPLHHAFEFTCGFLLPFAQGASVTYLERLDAESLTRAFTTVRPTAMIGVPALWQTLHRRVRQELLQRGNLVETAVDAVLAALPQIRRATGVNLAAWLLRSVHERFGGRLRLVVSGAAALPREVWQTFDALGFEVCEGYGITEAGPVLTVQRPGDANQAGDVGQVLPGVELRIADADADGAGEILARSPSLMAGYYRDRAATRATIADGWLRTGDVGRLDADGRLTIVGRRKEVIVDAGGKNISPEAIEERYAHPELIKEIAVVGYPSAGGGEQVAALIVPAHRAGESADSVRRAIRARVAEVSAQLPYAQRIKIWRVWDEELPRTATRKVRRAAVQQMLQGLIADANVAEDGADTAALADHDAAAWLRDTVASLADIDADRVHVGAQLIEDLGLDSLAFVELSTALEERTARPIDASELAAATTFGDLLHLVDAREQHGSARRPPVPRYQLEELTPTLPAALRRVAKAVVSQVQDLTYATALQTRVFGRCNIPYNRNVLVVANHSSHLDVGLVRHALGEYGQSIVTLAAHDYFFDSPLKRFYFTNFTNLLSFERAEADFSSLDDACRTLAGGHVVLMFPEGSRSADGRLQAFKPGVGYVVLSAEVDVLPVHLDGTHRILPKGNVVPRGREIAAHIGPVLPFAQLQKRSAGRQGVAAYRVIAEALHDAVAALRPRSRGGDAADVPRLREVFARLPERFVAGTVDRPVSFYFVVGDGAESRWTVIASPTGCSIKEGKASARADCVLKTAPELFLRIVEDGYVPPVSAFVGGEIKTNAPELLREFQRLFAL